MPFALQEGVARVVAEGRGLVVRAACELAEGAGEALPVIEEVVDGGPLLEIIVAPMAPSAQAPVFSELHVPQPEGLAAGIAELVYDRRRAPVVSK